MTKDDYRNWVNSPSGSTVPVGYLSPSFPEPTSHAKIESFLVKDNKEYTIAIFNENPFDITVHYSVSFESNSNFLSESGFLIGVIVGKRFERLYSRNKFYFSWGIFSGSFCWIIIMVLYKKKKNNYQQWK